ncbi:MAG TPA: 23S rRNA (uracil(1939)-C(5))-methyltransferase RlmD [Lachnospiraceae bacterium]|nr:23S rRNA (uracil(1939)-C(5))-methyltransferase RlmD [Lachnospiraceae bacterium]
MAKKNEIIEVKIEYIDFPNKGIGNFENYKVIVKNALPEQVAKCKITKKRDGKLEARLEEIKEHAPYEIKSGCSHFDLCGGCAYQNITMEKENEIKENQVLKLLDDAGIKGFKYDGIEISPVINGYRNKCEFSFGDTSKDGELALGMRKRQSFYEVVTLNDCNIIDKDFTNIIHCVLNFFKERNVPFYHKMRHDGILRHLVVRKGAYTGEILINLVTAKDINFSLEDFTKELLSLETQGKICGILHTENDSVADIVKSDKTKILYGRDYFTDKLFNLEFKVTAFSFFQTNTKGAEKLYSIVKEYAGDAQNKVIFDLYCGTGTISQIMAEKSKKVIGIEIIEEAIEAAKENAKLNKIENCEFIAGDVLKKVDELTDKPDLIIVDPPRDGIHPKAIGKIINFEAPEIIYVSCKPTSLARDLVIFESNGYKTKRVMCMNQFGRTSHVETVCLLVKE